MSDWRGHLKFGYSIQLPVFIILFLTAYFVDNPYLVFSLAEVVAGITLFIIAPLIPDLDHRSSKITNTSTVLLLLTVWVSIYFESVMFMYSLVALTLVVLISTFTKHRGITLSCLVIFSFRVNIVLTTGLVVAAVILIVGAWSHIWLDNRHH